MDGTPRIWLNSGNTIGFTIRDHDYVGYAPGGASWNVAGSVLSSSLAGKNYFTVAVLPTTTSSTDSDRTALASSYGTYAFAAVTGTKISYNYDQSSGTVTSTYGFTTKTEEGSQTKTVVSLYPHQWKALTGATPISQTYVSPRGTMKNLIGISSFTTAMKFHGILPELPAVADGSGADRATEVNYLNQVAGDPEAQQADDTYWTGKGLGRAARIAEISDLVGETGTRDKALAAIKSTLTDWFTATDGKTKHLFYYDKNWGTLIGYNASYGSDTELNDHHFHYGYYIAAAATLAKFDPNWAKTSQYGGMVDLLIRDANNYDRSDTRFPYLRDFDIYAGNDWASGHGSFAAGNNQESSSEGMNFAGALIQWGQATGNTAVRDAGIYIYTTEAAAIDDYWFDVDNTTFPAGFQHSTVGMVWGDGGAYATWFSADPAKIQGINQLPITGSHLYLGDYPAYNKINYDEMVKNSGGEPTEWQDVLWEFLALGDGDLALSKFKANSNFTSEEGESKAHTFHWIDNLATLGNVDASLTANSPLAAAFTKNGKKTYVVANISTTPLTVTFSDGTKVDRGGRQDGGVRGAELERRKRRRGRLAADHRPDLDPHRYAQLDPDRYAELDADHHADWYAELDSDRYRRAGRRARPRPAPHRRPRAGSISGPTEPSARHRPPERSPCRPPTASATALRRTPRPSPPTTSTCRCPVLRRRSICSSTRATGSAARPRSGSPTTSPATGAGTGSRPIATSRPIRFPATSTTPRPSSC